MVNDLVSPGDLAHLPGAPFSDEQVDEAVAAIRAEVGWHIAPVRSETVELDITYGQRWLLLPTRKLVSVDEVRDADTAEVVDPSEYRVSKALGQVKRDRYWPRGYEAVEVDLTHGYEVTPPELLPLVWARILLSSANPTVSRERIGDHEIQRQVNAQAQGATDVLSPYRLNRVVFA
jgi:hypothetical protein